MSSHPPDAVPDVVLPIRVRKDPVLRPAYVELVLRMVRNGTMRPTNRPLTVRNCLAFLVRLLGDRSPLEEGISTAELLRWYAARGQLPHTWTAVRSHAHWMTCLLRSGVGHTGGTVVTPGELVAAMGRPLWNGRTTAALRPSPVLRRHAFTVDEVRRLHAAAAAASPLDQVLLRLLFTTGLRVGGVSRLPLPAAASSSATWHVVTEEKGGVACPVSIAPGVQEALTRWWVRATLFLPAKKKGLMSHCPPRRPEQQYMFPARCDVRRPVSTSRLKRRFARLCAAAGVHGPHAHIHTTRHTAGTPPP